VYTDLELLVKTEKPYTLSRAEASGAAEVDEQTTQLQYAEVKKQLAEFKKYDELENKWERLDKTVDE